jgi:hypothetical protein
MSNLSKNFEEILSCACGNIEEPYKVSASSIIIKYSIIIIIINAFYIINA